MKKEILLSVVVALLFCGCGENLAIGDPFSSHSAAEPAIPAPMNDDVTKLGFKIQSNDYEYDTDFIDSEFLETESCLTNYSSIDFSDTPADLYIILKEPYSAFPCTPLPETGCGGLYAYDTITITADLYRLRHEYIHYILYYHLIDANNSHESDLWDKCEFKDDQDVSVY